LYNQLDLKEGEQISVQELKRRDAAYRRRFRTRKPFSIIPQLRAKAFALNGDARLASALEHYGLNKPTAKLLDWTDERAREALQKAGYSPDQKIGTLEFRKRIAALGKKNPYFVGLVDYIRTRGKAEYGKTTESLGFKAIGFTGNPRQTASEEEIRTAIEEFWPRNKIEAFKRGEYKLPIKGDFKKAHPEIYRAIRTKSRRKGKKNKRDQITFDQRLNAYVPGLANLVGPVSEDDQYIDQDISELFFAGEDIALDSLRYSDDPYRRKLACRIRKVARSLGVSFNEALEARTRFHSSEFVKDTEGIREVGRIAELLVKLAALGALAIDPERDGSIYKNGFAKIFNVPLIKVEPDLSLETEMFDEEFRPPETDSEEGEETFKSSMHAYLCEKGLLDPSNWVVPDLRTTSQRGNRTKNFAIEVKSGFHKTTAQSLVGKYGKGEYQWWDSELEEGVPMHGRIAAIMMRDKIVSSVKNELVDDGYILLPSERVLCYLGILFENLGRSPFHKAVAEAVPRLDSLQPVLHQAKEIVHNPHIMMRGTRTADRKFMIHNLEQLIGVLENMADATKPAFDMEEIPF
jgi:hypothetical protein